MSQIFSLKIDNFRNIKHFEQKFNGERFIVIIGRGDAGKTTILHAIQMALNPNWNVSFSDLDFHNMDTDSPIQIEVTLTDVPADLLTMDKFGLQHCVVRDNQLITDIRDESPSDITSEDTELCKDMALTIRLTVDKTLEPRWVVTSGRSDSEDKTISATDRAKFNMFMVSDYVDNHFSLKRQSPLQALLKRHDNIENNFSDILPQLRRDINVLVRQNNFSELKALLREIIQASKSWGLEMDELDVSLDIPERTYSENNLSLYEGNMPYRVHGKGSKRLLSMIIQNELAGKGGIVLIDEIEQGLEPDRIVNLVHAFKKNKSGQIFITTHSAHALVEANANNVFLIKNRADHLITFTDNDDCRSILRSQPEAFFAKKILCCEGKTEVGVIRAINDYLREIFDISFSSLGIHIANCQGGTNIIKHPLLLKKAQYDVCAFFDADDKKICSMMPSLEENNIQYATCQESLCLEQQVFKDLPWNYVIDLLKIASESNPEDTTGILESSNISRLEALNDPNELEQKRKELGEKAKHKNCAWFKDIDKGTSFGKIIISSYSDLDENCQLRKELDIIEQWIGVRFLKRKEDL